LNFQGYRHYTSVTIIVIVIIIRNYSFSRVALEGRQSTAKRRGPHHYDPQR